MSVNPNSNDDGWEIHSPQHQSLSNEHRVHPVHSTKNTLEASAFLVESDSETRAQAPRELIERSFCRGFFSSSWLIHLLSMGASIGVIQLCFREVYWSDEISQDEPMSRLGAAEVQNALQFAAKIHEILIMASISAIALHVARRMLLGRGIAWGLLAGVYQIGSVPYLFSSALRRPLTRKCARTWILALFLAAGVVYANLVGPASAIIIVPSLDWWLLRDPYNGRALTTFIAGSQSDVYPGRLDIDDSLLRCNTSGLHFCPGGGSKDIKSLTEAIFLGGVNPVTAVKIPVAETQRALSATLQFSKPGSDHVAVATTLHSSLGGIAGTFWNYISKNEVGQVNKVRRPRLEPTLDNLKAPVVQVQCAHYLWQEVHEGITPYFHSSGMRNLSSDGFHDDRYRDLPRWEIPGRFWNYTREDLTSSTFEWFDAASGFQGEGPFPSLGAVVTVPRAITTRYTNGSTEDRQDSLLLPCLIDARWAGVSTEYDPVDSRLPSNISDLSVFEAFWSISPEKPVPGGLPARNIAISPAWADLLNKDYWRAAHNGSGATNMSAIEYYMSTFLSNRTSDADDQQFASFVPPRNNGTTAEGLKLDHDDIARTMATILSLTVAEGLSRVSLQLNIGLVLASHNNGSSLWQDLLTQAGDLRTDAFWLPTTDLDGLYSITWKVQRYGRGYGRRETTVIFAIAILSLHIALVVLCALYMLCFRACGAAWTSSAWGGMHELMALALASPRPADVQLTTQLEKGKRPETLVTIKAQGDGKLSMVLNEQGVGHRRQYRH